MSRALSHRERAVRLRWVKAVQWLGLLWNFVWWGFAVLELVREPRLSDGISNAIPYAFAGGLGFCVAFALAWVIKRRAT
jgi:hypothetical protein